MTERVLQVLEGTAQQRMAALATTVDPVGRTSAAIRRSQVRCGGVSLACVALSVVAVLVVAIAVIPRVGAEPVLPIGPQPTLPPVNRTTTFADDVEDLRLALGRDANGETALLCGPRGSPVAAMNDWTCPAYRRSGPPRPRNTAISDCPQGSGWCLSRRRRRSRSQRWRSPCVDARVQVRSTRP